MANLDDLHPLLPTKEITVEVYTQQGYILDLLLRISSYDALFQYQLVHDPQQCTTEQYMRTCEELWTPLFTEIRRPQPDIPRQKAVWGEIRLLL
jgi:hypothetical protein